MIACCSKSGVKTKPCHLLKKNCLRSCVQFFPLLEFHLFVLFQKTIDRKQVVTPEKKRRRTLIAPLVFVKPLLAKFTSSSLPFRVCTTQNTQIIHPRPTPNLAMANVEKKNSNEGTTYTDATVTPVYPDERGYTEKDGAEDLGLDKHSKDG